MRIRKRNWMAVIAMGTWGCATPAASPEAELEQALRLAHGASARVVVSTQASPAHLLVLVDSPDLYDRPDSVAWRAGADTIGSAVVTQYQRAEALDSLTVRLVLFLTGAGASWCGYYAETYAVDTEGGMFPPQLRPAASDTMMGLSACLTVTGRTAAPAP